jgi:iduronate 2-sulfatase
MFRNCLALFAVLVCSFPLRGASPNILLICVDDLKPNLACFGDLLAKTPNIDRLASRGVLFESAYCNQAVCSPSRNALMVSLRPQTLGIYDLPTNFRIAAPQAVTMGEFFKNAGYRTEGLGKIFHVGHGNIDDAQSWSVPSWRPKAATYAQPTSEQGSKNGKNGPRGAAFEAGNVDDDFYADGMVAAEAIRRLESAKNTPETPFLLAVGFIRPHLPFASPKKYWDLYDRNAFFVAKNKSAPEGAPSYAPQQGSELRGYKDVPEQGSLPDDMQKELIHGYYAATSYTDAQIGRLIDALDRLQLSKDTIIVLWGDHGWHLGDHGIWCKHTNYEQATRIPVVVVDPRSGAKGAKTKSMIESVDIFPTLAELAGQQSPTKIDGKSFASVIKDPTKSARDHVINVYPRSPKGKGETLGRAIRTARYRLVEWKPFDNATDVEFELYDYQDDPLETRNLASERPEVVKEIMTLLAAHPAAKRQISGESSATPSNSTSPGDQDRSAIFARRDKDSNGKLTREEFLQGQKDMAQAETRFGRFDKDGDGVLTKDEFITQGR